MRRIILLIVALLAAVPASAQNPVSVSQWKTVPVDTGNGTTTTGTLRVTITSDSTGTVAATQSGTWNITNISGTVSLPTLASTSTKQSDGSQKTQIVDGSGNVIASTSNNLNVQCANCSGSGASAADQATFTAGSSTFAPAGGFFQTTATNNALTTGQQGMWQMTATRAGFVNLRNAAGTEVGTSTTPVQVSLANTGANSNKLLVTPDSVALPANQSVNISQLAGTTTDTNSGSKSAGTLRVVLATDQPALTNKLLVTPDSVALPANQSVNISQMNGVTTTMGNGASGTGVQRVTIANDSTGTIIATQATGTNLHVVCDSGCSSSAGFADNAAFTYGTTAINPIGGVLDDVATNSATENSAAVARITAKKALHVNLRDNSGNEIIAPVDATTNTTTQTTGPQVFANGSTATPTAVGADGRSVALWSTLSGSLHTTCDSGCSGGTTDADDGTIASGQTTGLNLGLNQVYDGTNWRRMTVGTAGTASAQVVTVQGVASMTKLLVTPDSVALPANQSVNVNQLAGTTTDTNSGNKSAGTLRVVLATDQPALTNKLLVTPDANSAVNVAQMNGVTVTMGAGATGTGVQRVNDVASSATGAAPPASAAYVGGLGSGATGGFLIGMPVADGFQTVSITSATTTLLVTGVSGRHVRISAINLVTAIANNVALISGTGATCGTGTTGIAGGTTSANGWNFAANGGLTIGSGVGTVIRTTATGDSICAITSAAGPLAGTIAYTIY